MSSSPVIVVTGGNRGIGLEICRQLSSRGAQVVLTARNLQAGRKAVESFSSARHQVEVAPLEVTSDASALALRDFVEKKFGHCDVLINNAGIVADGDDDVLIISPSLLEQTLATNTVAPLRLVQSLLPLLRKSKPAARVINVSSGAGELTDFTGSWSPAYSLSKAALNLLTRMLAPALQKEKIAINSMCPGWVRTEMGGANAPRSVEQGADTAVWLALDAPSEFSGNFIRDRKVIPW